MKKKSKTNRSTIYYVVFLLAWAALSLIISQFIVALPMVALLGDQITKPLWISTYDLLTYSLSLALVLLVPPRLAKLVKNKTDQSSNPPHSAKTGSSTKITPAQQENTFVKDLTTNSEELGINKWPTLTDIGLAPIGYVVYIFVANLATNLMQIFPWFDAERAQDVGFNGLISGPDRFFAMLALVFIAPIVEELVMRGWLFGKLRAKLKFVPAMLLTSLLFAVLHGQWNVGVSVFFLSIIMCSLREITGSLWSGILLHMLNNGIAFYILYILML